jgi:CheY-like chemotaxis protein
MNQKSEVTILLVEDDQGHAVLIERNLRRFNLINEIIRLDDGQKTLDFIFAQGDYSSRERPSSILLLLDLDLPVIDGYKVLSRLKANEETKRIPIIVLTATDSAAEVARCYELGCNVFITKPIDYEKFTEALRSLGLFLSVMSVPRTAHGAEDGPSD